MIRQICNSTFFNHASVLLLPLHDDFEVLQVSSELLNLALVELFCSLEFLCASQ
jgi:hypothetical protein